MEAVTEHFRALLEACVAVSAAATASLDEKDITTHVQTVDLSIGLTSEQLRYWDSICEKSIPLVQDLALLLASTNVSVDKMLSILRVMLVHPSFHCSGVLQLAHMTFDSFKVAKRWDALNAVSIHLIDAVYAKIQQPETRKQALWFYIDILVGFQHSAELYTMNLKRIINVAELLSTEDKDENKREMIHQLLVMCAALEHCHRGYEAEAMTLRRTLRTNFGPQVTQPTAAEAERLLRSSAWVLPADKVDAILPSIEGKWVVDEFNNDPHGNGGPQNAGSVLLKKTANCFAYDMQATMTDRKLKQKLELSGCFFRRIPEIQVLLSLPETTEVSRWELEGHWRQLYDENTPVKAASMAPSPVLTWDCRACTMNNEGTAIKCSTCGTDRPAEVNMPPIPCSSKGSNPAPFSAVFDSDLSFMRMRWSRGEQQGVWLARKQTIETCFDLGTSLEAANNEMMDSTYLPAFVYSPKGNPASVLVLEQPLLSMTKYTDFTIQVWICPEPSPSPLEDQVVLANGRTFALLLTSTGHLMLQLVEGQYLLTSRDAVPFGTFCHVTLASGQDKIALFVDGSMVGETTRVAEAGPSALETSLLTIGGSLESCGSSKKDETPSCFYGQIVDLRIWSTLVSNLNENWSIWTALSGHEAHLVGYFPLVGNTERLLMDLSKEQNHACVFEGYQSADALPDGSIASIRTFVPVVPTDAVPVKNTLAVSLGKEFVGTGKFSLLDCAREGDRGLQIDCRDGGAALWRQHAVSFANGFESVVSIAAPVAVDSRKTIVFALCEATFWDLAPFIAEATYLSNDAQASTLRLFEGSALLVKIGVEVTTSGVLMYELEVYIWSKQHPNPLVRVFRVAGGPSISPSDVRIKYQLPERVLSLAIGGVGHVLEAAVDLELALRVEKPGSPVRTGLIFPSQQETTAIGLLKWTFEALNENMVKEATSSILGNVYPSLQADGLKADRGGKNGENDTVVCTRVSTDGSAIAQEAYGCQTCSLVHENCVCRLCAVICHEGHELVALGVTTTACACRIRGNGLCRCTSAIPASDIALNQSVDAHLWGCIKCTVINRIELKQCSVCGNNRPDRSAIGSSGVPEASSSTSLVVRKEPKPALDWSCEACTMLNDATEMKCSMCDTPQPKQVNPDVVKTTHESKPNNGLTTLCYAAEGAAKPNQALAMQPVGSWICSACTMENQAADKRCYVCATARELPVAAVVDPSDTMMALSTSKLDATPPSPVMSMEMDGSDKGGPSGSATDWHVAKLENVKLLAEYKRTAVLAVSTLLDIGAMNNEVWETTGGKMQLTLDTSFVGEYICGTYVEKDGKVSGLARLTNEGAWKLDGRYKKSSQSQSNACTLYWDKAASRFDGKWYRGDGSGDWKCLAWPNASDFRGLAPVDPVKKKPNDLQPYYAGMVNMKQNLTNVCYQNSFLQTLYMTQDFRRLMLSWDTQNHMTLFGEDGGLCGANVVATIQQLFAQMTASQRPYVATQALQRCLPPEFQNGRQQDTSDFAHFLMDSLTQQLSQQEDTVADDIPSIFGGHQATILACKVCGNKSINREYFWELLLNMIDLRYTPIISISAVSGSSMDIHTPEGYERLNTDLNKDRTGAPYVYLCVKRCPEWASTNNSIMNDHERILPITELMVKVTSSTDAKPAVAGYERVELDLNLGGSALTGGKKQVYLFFRREPGGSPITDLQVIYGSDPVPDGFKQIQVDLNQGDGSKVFLCYRCDMPITDLKIVSSGLPGYRMIDHLLNVSPHDGEKQYLALKVGGNEPCLTDLKLVEGSAVSTHEQQGWESIGSVASVAESSPAGTSLVTPQLMVRRGHGNPIFAIDVFRAPRRVPKYNDYEVIDLHVAEETCTDVVECLKGGWIGTEDTDRGRKAVQIRSVSDSIPNALLVKGAVDDKGELTCVATRLSTWSDAMTKGSVESVVPTDRSLDGSTKSSAPAQVYRVSGYWKTSKIPNAQLFDVELRPAPSGVSGVPDSPADISSSQGESTTQSYTMYGTIGDGTGKPLAIKGVQTSRKVKVKWPISELVVLRGEERVPEGLEVVRETCSGRSGNLLTQTASPHTLYLALKREEAPGDGYITDICVIYGEIDAVPDHYTCIETTPAGYSANLNDGTSGVPIFICVKKRGEVPAVHPDDASYKSVMDLALMWTSGTQPDSLPSGFTKLQHTPLGMEANLNQGTGGVAIHLCVSKCETKDIITPLENPLNGEYELMSSPLPAFGRFLSLSVVEELDDARVVDGTFGVVLHAQSTGSMSGILASSTLQQTGMKKRRVMIGAWRSESPMGGHGGVNVSGFLPSSYPFELTLNDAGTELDGWWSGAEAVPANAGVSVAPASGTASVLGGKWKLVKDGYVHVAFKRDYGTEWQDGKLVFSERVWHHDIESMLSRFVATRTLGGDNALLCSTCECKTESRTHTVIVDPPEHLIITLKRMYYDWSQQKACKCLHDVRFPAFLTLPSLTAEEQAALYDVEDEASSHDKQSRHYGLYGVLVHSGLTANSGHYYSFCRESDESTCQLHLEDSPLSPWIKFNDTKVERSNWKEIHRVVSGTVSDTVYLLLYKKLSYEPTRDQEKDASVVESVTSDDDEAMLLAKAMALSMSAKQEKEKEEKGRMDENSALSNTEDVAGHSTRGVTKALLQKVEKENAAFLHDSVAATSSALHADDLYTLLVLRHSMPLHLRELLEKV